MIGLVILVAVLLLVALAGVPGAIADEDDDDGIPDVPAAYYGEVTVDGDPAPEGTEIVATIDGEERGSIAVTEPGEYGGPDAFDEKLTVGGTGSDEVTFEIQGIEADQTVTWESGDVQQVDLTFTDVPDETGSDPAGDGTDGQSDDGTDADGQGGADGDGSADDGGETDDEGAASDDNAVEDGDGTDPDADSPTAPSDEATEEAAQIVHEEADDLELDPETDRAQVTFSADSSVDTIAFNTDAVAGSVSVTELDREPDETGSAPGTAVSVTEISVPAEATDQDATVRMRVSTDRLTEIDADPATLRVNRFTEGDWQKLDTDVVAETDDYVVLEAETPGFSYFSVSAVSDPDARLAVEPETIAAGSEVTLDGSGSTDEHGEIVAYDWSIADQRLEGEEVTTTVDEPGEYTVELTVTTDAGETDTATDTLAVETDDSGTGSTDGSGANGETGDDADEDGSSDGTGDSEDAGVVTIERIVGLLVVVTIGVLAVTLVRRKRGSSTDPL